MRVMAALPLFRVLVSLEFCPVVLWCFRLGLGSNLAVVVEKECCSCGSVWVWRCWCVEVSFRCWGGGGLLVLWR
ncbi:hypothetical protein TSUD_247070 [Trifolium subterraneum]|uniref:Uncharacterized protein n=1 Tax=Trifolium subterraneum TaxID=3900 RepID=A0A2Z6LZB0_TRISU|nr:hypothetical protein TSUD_247070 [Trifolium subterraneum]